MRFTPTRVGKTGGSLLAMAGQSVHPHAGGENIFASPISSGLNGSPPRGWGKLEVVYHAVELGRFTPTRVGKTGALFASFTVGFGSPPRGWGKLVMV